MGKLTIAIFNSYVKLPEGTPKTVVFNTQKVQMVSKWCPKWYPHGPTWMIWGANLKKADGCLKVGYILIQLPFEEGQFKGIHIISEIEQDDFQCTLWIIRGYVGRLRVKSSK